ncbi:Glyoxalase/Bleomycin resistance protein/Dihydroxybiphenyl dioxygenase [Schizothecium vesticola]|uniref:Glyoxalase/Bleomycin resistance protein/Dihydroxybiphenyl dioxygenase n=1 Tax=Schizothecium vesticola TaxID=314040 RepID=A0AA40EPG2_9PEZI|nr:Glyoxalase/Bleomycin resistance protein/Dihydroxybiphenyl dioxygenase [Schizothecium vesticola]
MPSPTTHPRPLGHLSLPITHHPTSRAFYTAALAPLGLHLVYDSEDPAHGGTAAPDTKKRIRTLGYGPDPSNEILNLFEYPPTPESRDKKEGKVVGPAGFHVAFNAPTRDAVVAFHTMALAAGGTDNGRPGLREGYGRGYFAAFVVDPDGWRVEAVN